MVAIEELLARPALAEDGPPYTASLRENGFQDSRTILLVNCPEDLGSACNIPASIANKIYVEAAAAEAAAAGGNRGLPCQPMVAAFGMQCNAFGMQCRNYIWKCWEGKWCSVRLVMCLQVMTHHLRRSQHLQPATTKWRSECQIIMHCCLAIISVRSNSICSVSCPGDNLEKTGKGDSGALLVEQLIGPLPERWPDGGWRVLVEEDVGRKLPVELEMYRELMGKDPHKWGSHITEASGLLPTFIYVCLDVVRCQVLCICQSSSGHTRAHRGSALLSVIWHSQDDFTSGDTSDTMCRSYQLIKRSIGKISDNAGSRYLLTYSGGRYVALRPAASGLQLFWSTIIENRLICTGRNKVISASCLN